MSISNFAIKPVSLGGQKSDKNFWNTKKIDRYLYNLENGIAQEMQESPYFERKIGLRKGNINFKYNKEEEEEISRCMEDVVYFADKYSYAMTDEGVQKITLRDYQRSILRQFQKDRFLCYLSGRQQGKTIISAIYMIWYICCNYDRNVMIVANKSVTMMEIIDKMKIVYQHLPFFLKPGLLENNKSNMKFDNGCRIQGQATSSTPALGFAIHLLYADEFAHIPANIVEPFYRSIYPTLSSSNISQMIITSTPNGINKFYEIYHGAWTRKNEFTPLRTDWHEVPGRDEEWKKREIANLGSEDLFNQEYGNQFLSVSNLLLDNITIKKLEKLNVVYEHRKLKPLDDANINYEKLLWHPKLKWSDFDFNPLKDRIIISIDIADGVGEDYSVANIFKLEPMSLAKIRTLDKYKDEASFFRLRQIGVYHSNTDSIDEFSDIVSSIVFDLFGAEIVKLVIEMNFKGDMIVDRLEKHDDFFIEMLLHTKHSQTHEYLSPGLKLNKKIKPLLCNAAAKMIKNNKIIPTENQTFFEASSFGLNKDNNYCCQIGHDDLMISIVNAASYIESTDYYEAVEDIIDYYSSHIRDGIYKKLSNIKDEDKKEYDYTFLNTLFN